MPHETKGLSPVRKGFKFMASPHRLFEQKVSCLHKKGIFKSIVAKIPSKIKIYAFFEEDI